MTESKRTVVYTALVGGYDFLRPVPKHLVGIDFVCYTDGSVSEKLCEKKGWSLRMMPAEVEASRKGCRILKSLPQRFFGDYDTSVWLDSNISFTKKIETLVAEFNSNDFLIRGFRHPLRSCAYLEARECIRLNKDKKENLYRMIERMRQSGFPEEKGLTETNVLFRKHNLGKVRDLNNDWFYFLSDFTIRDQISFDFLCWHHGIDIGYFEGSTHHNNHPVFSRGLHRSRNKLKNAFAYFESLQGVYPSIGKAANLFYKTFG